MLWGSSNSVFGTSGIYCNPSISTVYATNFSGNWNGYSYSVGAAASTVVLRDSSGYITNSYFYTSGGGSERNSSGLGYIAGFNSSDYYIRSYNSTAVASFLGLGSMAYASTGSYYTAGTSDGRYVYRGGDTVSGTYYFNSDKGSSSYVGGQSSYSLEATSNDSGAAGMSFHRRGVYAVNMGLDPDNVIRIGGWSAPANLLQMDMGGNLTMAGYVSSVSHHYSGGQYYATANYGYGLVGLYSSTVLQGIFAMGDSYKLTAGGGANNLYGLGWSHPNAGGQSSNLASHGLLVMVNGITYAALSSNLWLNGGSISGLTNVYFGDNTTSGIRNVSNSNWVNPQDTGGNMHHKSRNWWSIYRWKYITT